MRINTQEKLQRLERSAALLLKSDETLEVKSQIGNQINIYRTALEQAELMPEHNQSVHAVIAPIDAFCSLTEKTFAHLMTQGETQ